MIRRNDLIALAAGAAFAAASIAALPDPAREPRAPGAWWVWADWQEAEGFARDNPRVSLCLVQVADGVASYRCPRPVRG